MARWLEAGLWGFVAGGALLLGAGLGYGLKLPRRLVAGVMAFGAGVLVSALSFELMDEAVRTGGFLAAAFGFIGGAVSWVTVAAVFISNVPEGLSSSVGMRRAGRSARYVFGVWLGVAVVSGLASLLGEVAFQGISPSWIAAILGIAAGGILAMLADTMIPEAFSEAHDLAGLITAVGFLCAFFLSKFGG